MTPCIISGRRFSSLRRSLLYNPGDGARHELVIETTGLDKNDAPTAIRTDIIDPQGQTHLTAAGTLIQLERLLGLDGARPSAPGIVYPDTAPQIDSALEVLHEFNVTVVTN